MPRLRPRVITALDAERNRTRSAERGSSRGGPEGQEDSYLAKLIKYIPAEAIATHQALAGFDSPANAALVGWLSVALLPCSVFWYFIGTKDKGEDPAWFQIIFCPIAFAMWMVVVQSPAVRLIFHGPLVTPTQGSILLIFVTAVIPILEWTIVQIAKRFK